MKLVREKIIDWIKLLGGWVSVGLSALFGSRAGDRFGILMYHRVADATPRVPRPTRNVTPRQFERQMEGLLAAGYQVWPLSKVIEQCEAEKSLPPKVCVITFDDGYRNVYVNAWPVLQRLRIPATIFVTTAYLGSDEPFPFDKWGRRHREKVNSVAWAPLSWGECQEMESSGLIEIGTHTHTHTDFRNKSDLFQRDLLLSLEALHERLGVRPYPFAFPFGGRQQGYSSPALVEMAKQTGVTSALTTEMELVSPRSSPFTWGRFEAVASDTGATLDAKLKGWYNWMGSIRETVRRVGLAVKRRAG